MKKINILLIALCGVLTIVSCKKKEEDTNTTTTPTTITKPDSVKFSTTVYTVGTKTAQFQNGKWFITGNYGSGNSIWIYTGLTAVPATNMTLSIISPGAGGTIPTTLSASQAYIYLVHSADYHSYWGGSVNITVNNGVITLGLNNVKFSLTSTGTQIPLWMQMTK
ncbi:MAG: hypothetical protein HYU69_11225 [Bacteroidetes bacterium]|nr:hypothetical protein [Bacteroidota bacterium]